MTSDNSSGISEASVNIYSTLPLHGITAIPGKIPGALMVAGAIKDAVPLIHGPIGCAYQRKINPFKPYSPFYDTPCTDMNDMDVVYGGEERLEQGIKEIYKKYHPNLIMVLTTCPSDLIGDDVDTVIQNVREEVDCDIVACTGDRVGRSKPMGYQDALYAITDHILSSGKGDIEKNDCSVNIVTFPIHGAGVKVAEMVSVFGEMGIGVNKVCFDDTHMSDLYDLPKADLNITDYPMAWTKLMKERQGIEHYEILGWERYKKEKDPELFSPYGIDGSTRIFRDIAKVMGKEGEAEDVIKRRRGEAEERLNVMKKDLEGLKIATMGGLHGVGLKLLKEIGVDVNVLVCRTQMLEKKLTEKAINEMVDISLNLARMYGFDPEPLVNPTVDEEIKAYKKMGVDIVITPSTNAHFFNREGIRTFNPTSFVFHHQRVGFECSIELCQMLRSVLKKPQRRNPLLSMLDYDPYRSGLTPHWAALADMFGTIREEAVGDKIAVYA